jgi:hypothetical protein
MTLRLLIPGILAFLVHLACAALTPLDLRCDGMSGSPTVGASPRLSWRVGSSHRGQAQSARQVLVASSAGTWRRHSGKSTWMCRKTAS